VEIEIVVFVVSQRPCFSEAPSPDFRKSSALILKKIFRNCFFVTRNKTIYRQHSERADHLNRVNYSRRRLHSSKPKAFRATPTMAAATASALYL